MNKHFGNTFSETSKALMGEHLGEDNEIKKKEAVARIVISLLLLVTAIFFIIKVDIMEGESLKDIGEIVLGGIIGYWLK